MTVQQLIDKLQQIEDKSLPIYINDTGYGWTRIETVNKERIVDSKDIDVIMLSY